MLLGRYRSQAGVLSQVGLCGSQYESCLCGKSSDLSSGAEKTQGSVVVEFTKVNYLLCHLNGDIPHIVKFP